MSAGDLVVWPNGGLEFPVNYREQAWGFRWTSPFGMRTHPVTGQPSTMHYGLDLIGWDIIKSPYTGVVTFAGYNGGAGNEVRIKEDGTGDYVRLMHNRALWVSTGQRVTQGQDVAVMGTTGSSTGVHCHEEIHPGGGAAVDPMNYYRNRNSSASGGGSSPFNPGKASEEEDTMLIIVAISNGSGSGAWLKKGLAFADGLNQPLTIISQSELNALDYWAGKGIPYRRAEWEAKDILALINKKGVRPEVGSANRTDYQNVGY